MNNADQRLVARIAQTIAIQVMDLSPCERSGSIQREVDDWRSFYQQALSDPRTLAYSQEFADRLEALAGNLVARIDRCGGTMGRA